jgi:hypothetical protein
MEQSDLGEFLLLPLPVCNGTLSTILEVLVCAIMAGRGLLCIGGLLLILGVVAGVVGALGIVVTLFLVGVFGALGKVVTLFFGVVEGVVGAL